MLKLKVNSLYSLEAFIRTDNVLCWLIICCLAPELTSDELKVG